MIYRVYKPTDEEPQYVAVRLPDGGAEEFLGRRPKYKPAQLLCAQKAGRDLDWVHSKWGWEAHR